MAVDYNFKLGTGLARFGQAKRAEIFLNAGLQLAEQHKLHAWYFKVEDAIRKLAAAEPVAEAEPAASFEDAEPLREIESGLREFAAAGTI
jgi:hypothetical protein